MKKFHCRTVSFSRLTCLCFILSSGLFFLELHPERGMVSFSGMSALAEMEADKNEEQELADKAEGAILALAAKNDWFKNHVTKAKAIFIAPDLYRGRVLTGGSGLLLVRQDDGWSQKAFYRVEVPDLGFNLGSDKLEIVLLISSHMGLSSFYTGSFQLGRGLQIADGNTVGQSSFDDLTVDVVSFTKLQSTGTYTAIPLKGVSITVSDDFNKSFYGTVVTPVEIIQSISVSELGFSGLLSALRHEPICPKQDKTLCKTED